MVPIIILGSLDLGGSERVGLYLFQRFKKYNPETKLIVLFGTKFKEIHLDKGIFFLDAKNNIGAFLSLVKFIRALKGDLAYFGLSEKVNFFLVFSRFIKLINGKVILRPSTLLSKMFVGKKKFRRILSTIQYSHADTIICQSNAIKNDLEKNFKVPAKKIRVIHNPFTRDLTHTLLKNQENKEDKKDVYIACVGHLRSEKGHLRLLRLFANTKTPIKLLLVGEGPERSVLEAFITSHNLMHRVILLGEVQNPIPIMSEACGLVIPSYVEGYPNVAIEAAYIGLPIIGFIDCEALFEVVENNINGWLIPPDDSATFEKLLEKLTTGTKTPFIKLIERHNPDVVFDQYLQLLLS